MRPEGKQEEALQESRWPIRVLRQADTLSSD